MTSDYILILIFMIGYGLAMAAMISAPLIILTPKIKQIMETMRKEIVTGYKDISRTNTRNKARQSKSSNKPTQTGTMDNIQPEQLAAFLRSRGVPEKTINEVLISLYMK